MDLDTRQRLNDGVVIPAHPLALNASRKMDERRQRALTRYYIDAGAGGVALGVHTTQFAIRGKGLYAPVLELGMETIRTALASSPRPFVKIGGVVGPTEQAVAEAKVVRDLGFDCALLGLGALPKASDDMLIAHCREIASIIPVFGFYLQTAVGGRVLGYEFWRRFAEIENVVAIKIAPFNRYQSLDVIRAVADSGREDIALYTGNDDNILADLVTPVESHGRRRWCVGGLLGQWAVWTSRATEMLARAKEARSLGQVSAELLREGSDLTEANAAIFDVRNAFAGCIAGIHEVLRRQGLLEGIWCLDPNEGLSSRQLEQIDRVERSFPHLTDNAFVAEHRDRWLA
jgi:dihydrodipicolinate synthase/N-acetylneuraminate lyase